MDLEGDATQKCLSSSRQTPAERSGFDSTSSGNSSCVSAEANALSRVDVANCSRRTRRNRLGARWGEPYRLAPTAGLLEMTSQRVKLRRARTDKICAAHGHLRAKHIVGRKQCGC